MRATAPAQKPVHQLGPNAADPASGVMRVSERRSLEAAPDWFTRFDASLADAIRDILADERC